MVSKRVEESDRDFEAIYDAVTSTPQGRWFLEEFGRRNRHSDTLTVINAIEKMANTTSGNDGSPVPAAFPDVTEELDSLSDVLDRFRNTYTASGEAALPSQIPEFIDELEHHLLRTRDFLGITDNAANPMSDENRKDQVLQNLPPELADEAALVDGFHHSVRAKLTDTDNLGSQATPFKNGLTSKTA